MLITTILIHYYFMFYVTVYIQMSIKEATNKARLRAHASESIFYEKIAGTTKKM
jgi:cytochrome b subunit of formate dehydrogenase